MATHPEPPPPRADWAWFLDVDGTLVDIAPTPERVRPVPGLVATLERLRDLAGGALALVSGRRIADLDRLFWPLRLPVAGIHGLERRTADGRIERAPPAELGEVYEAMAAFAGADERLRIEDKGLSLALHYRLAPEKAAMAEAFADALVEESRGALRILRGKMVIEAFRAAAHSDKGRAIAAFMAEPPFLGRIPFFAGDDVTDEYGFAAARDLGGVALRIGAPAASAATHRLPSVAAFHTWLQAATLALPAPAEPPTGGTAGPPSR